MEYCSGCNCDHSPDDCSYGMTEQEYQQTLEAQDWYLDFVNGVR